MAARQIDIFAGLRRRKAGVLPGTNTQKDKMTIGFAAPDLVFQIDDDAIVSTIANACAEAMRQNMLDGKSPSGSPLPPAAPSTVIRRRYRELQFQRGGQVAPRFQDKRRKGKAQKHYRFAKRKFAARFKWKGRTVTEKLVGGLTYRRVVDPGGMEHPDWSGRPRGLFGLDSGLLAKSFVGVPEGRGRYTVHVANNRSIADRSGKSAMTRVFDSGKVPVWSRAAMMHPEVQSAMRSAMMTISKQSRRRFARALVQTAQSVASLANDVTDTE